MLRDLEHEWVGPRDAPVWIFLHEGLGSVALWKDFPRRLCEALPARGLVYSRAGYGTSGPRKQAYTPRFLHDEAEVLDALATELGLASYALFGHSDGASIALLHAARSERVTGAVVMAPHLFVEEVALASIRAARAAYPVLRPRLARYHADVDSAFFGWNDIWLDPEFARWSIRDEVARVRCPVLAIQGRDDEYGTLAQLDVLARLAPQTTQLVLDACGHSPQRDRPDTVIEATVAWRERFAIP